MMKSLLFLALFALIATRTADCGAQTAGHPAPASAATSPSPGLSPDEAQRALDVLQDPQKRDQLIATLRAIAKAAPTTSAAAAGAPAAQAAPDPAKSGSQVTLKPNSLGAQLLVALSRWSARFAGDVAATLQTMNSLPDLWRWLVGIESNPEVSLSLAVNLGWLALVFGCAVLLEFFTVALLGRPRGALTRRLPTDNGEYTRLLQVLPHALIRLVFYLAPVAVFTAAGNLLVSTLPVIDETSRLVVLAVVNAYAATRVVMCVARMVLSPDDKRLRLWRLDDAGARFVLIWVRRIAAVSIFGGAILDVALLRGLNYSAHDGFERLIELAIAAMLIAVVIRSRQAVADYIRGGEQDPAASGARWRSWLAEAWPYLAVIAVLSFWLGIATGTGGGLGGLYFPGVTLGVIIVGRLLTIIVLGVLERLLRLDPAQDRLPGFNRRVAYYRRPLEALVMVVITLLCGVVLLQLWGAPAFWFFAGGIGSHLLSAAATVTVAVIAAVAIWEISHAVLERQLAYAGSGQGRPARLLTLMPILRSTLLVAIITVVGLTALSEIGVNIAPLLAGAGIVGIAVGFGAQHLVQDVITGIFLLFENALQIGDAVTAAGLTGSVEQLSVRTMRLRAGDGAVHTIPFSSVTTITNTNRGIGNAAISVTVAYQEDVDRVMAVLSEIGGQMREEESFKLLMLGDVQIFGVDQLRPWGVTITGQITCTDGGRWPVQREFGRRLKQRFDAEKIALAAPPGATA